MCILRSGIVNVELESEVIKMVAKVRVFLRLNEDFVRKQPVLECIPYFVMLNKHVRIYCRNIPFLSRRRSRRSCPVPRTSCSHRGDSERHGLTLRLHQHWYPPAPHLAQA